MSLHRRTLWGSCGLVLLAIAFALAVRRHPIPSSALTVAVGISAIAVALLAMVRQRAAIGAGLVLLAVVRFQPAPTDAVFALVMAAALLRGEIRASGVPSVVLALLGGLLALNLISTVLASSLGAAIVFLLITLYLMAFGAWLASYVDRHSRARLILLGYLAAALITAALGVLASVMPIPGRSALLFDGRAMALFKDPNVYGPFLVPALLILLEETVTPRMLRWRRDRKLAGLILLAVGVLFSYSRGAWFNLGVGLVVMLAVLFLRRPGARVNIRLLVLVLVLVTAAAGAVIVSGSNSFLGQRAHFQGYDTGRFNSQQAGIKLGEQHPVGVGPGQFDVLEPLSPHSLYVRVFAEQGPLGLLLLLVLLGVTAGFAVRNVIAGRSTYGIGSAALLGAWCGILANSAVIDTLHWRHLWLVAALIWSAAASRSAPPVERSASTRQRHSPRLRG